MMMNKVPSMVLASAALLVWGSLRAQQTQTAAPRGGGRGQGGAGRASQLLFEQQCSGCHGGTDGTLGPAPNLFNAKWLATVSDDDVQKIVREGIYRLRMNIAVGAGLVGREGGPIDVAGMLGKQDDMMTDHGPTARLCSGPRVGAKSNFLARHNEILRLDMILLVPAALGTL